jgi:hypothetical protein
MTVWVTHSKENCNHSILNVFSVFTSRCLVAASTGGRFPSSGFPNCPLPQLPASHFSQLQLSTDSITTQVKFMLRPTVSRPVCFDIKPPSDTKDLIFIAQAVAGLLMWGALSDERTGLPFTIAAGPRQRSQSRVRVPRDSRPYFIVSDSRPPTWRARSPYLYLPGTGWPSYAPKHWVPFSQPPTTRWATKSQTYFTTGGLPPISSSWRQAPWGPRPEFFFPQLNSCSKSLCNILSDEKMGVSLMAGLRATTPRYIVPARTAQKTSLPLYVPSLPGKRLHKAVC